MSYSLPKGRNYSKENLVDKKYYGARHSEKANLLSVLSSVGNLQDRNNAKTLNRRESEDVLVKRNVSSQMLKPLGALQNYDSKYSNLNKKIRDILDNTNANSSEQNSYSTVNYQNSGMMLKNLQQSQLVSSSSMQQLNKYGNISLGKQKEQTMSKSTFVQRKTESLNKDRSSLANISSTMDKGQNLGTISNYTNNQSGSVLYFLECLRRKNSITTQFYINIHTSILTFKQFYKLAHQSKAKSPDPTVPPENPNRKTVVLDMDQTLIHTSEIMTSGYQIKVPFKAFQGKVTSGYVNVRPYAKQLLKKLSKYFDVIVFTAGNKCYADPILDHIDPTGAIQHRLYRQSCTFVGNQLFVKDLRVLGRNLANVVLVDNAPHSYMLQLANGIPILNYFKGKDDNQLVNLQKYLMTLLDVQDVRIPNSEYFRLHEYMKYDSHDKLIAALYSKKIFNNG